MKIHDEFSNNLFFTDKILKLNTLYESLNILRDQLNDKPDKVKGDYFSEINRTSLNDIEYMLSNVLLNIKKELIYEDREKFEYFCKKLKLSMGESR